MSVRTDIIDELQTRLAGISNNPLVLINSEQRVTEDDFPAIEVVTGEDNVTEENISQDWPYLDRAWPWEMIVWVFDESEDESIAFKRVEAFHLKVRRAIFDGGTSLGGKVLQVSEIGTGFYVKPPGGGSGIGLVSRWSFRYKDDIAAIMNYTTTTSTTTT